jgi:UDP-GlcNAc:undecaprenyl-phosphate GlcNAc-1-phosphate transferase
MLDVYLLTVALAGGIGLLVAVALRAFSSTGRFAGFFRAARGADEKPRWGGLAIFMAFAITPFLASAISSEADELFTPKSGDFLGFLGACALVFLVGFWDDWRVATWKQKLLVQVMAASAVYAAGYTIDRVGLPWGPEFGLGPMGPVVTVLWVVFFTNAINLIDGRDGVAGGVAILAAVTLAQVASHAEHPTVALLLVAMAGGSLGFLPFNLPRASAYLGDSGALLLGFILGSLSIRGSTGPGDAVFIAVPVVALGFPILDTVLAMVRRVLDRRHPLLGDLDHIHDRLERGGFGPRGLLVVLYAITVLFSGAAILLHYVRHLAVEAVVFAALAALVGLILTRLGYLLSLWNSQLVMWLRRKALPFEPSPSWTPGGTGATGQGSRERQ